MEGTQTYATVTHHKQQNFASFVIYINNESMEEPLSYKGQFRSDSKTKSMLNTILYGITLTIGLGIVNTFKVMLDSPYLDQLQQDNLEEWEQKDWKYHDGRDIPQQELWKRVYQFMQEYDLSFQPMDPLNDPIVQMMRAMKVESRSDPVGGFMEFRFEDEGSFYQIPEKSALPEEEFASPEEESAFVEEESEEPAFVEEEAELAFVEEEAELAFVEEEEELAFVEEEEELPFPEEEEEFAFPEEEEESSFVEEEEESSFVEEEGIAFEEESENFRDLGYAQGKECGKLAGKGQPPLPYEEEDYLDGFQEGFFQGYLETLSSEGKSPVYLDNDLTTRALEMFEEIGLPLEVAITIFLKDTLRKKGVTLDIKL